MSPNAVRVGRIRFERVAKPGGGHRILTVLEAADQRSYAALVRPLTRRIESSLTPGVIANRVGPRGSLHPVAATRAAWRRRLERSLSAPGLHVIVSDVTSFYPSVTDVALAASLRRAGAPSDHVTRLVAFLDALREGGVDGLPVGPEPSAILANAVLAGPDRAVLASGAELIRWVDDVVLIADGATRVRRAFDSWRRALAERGLSVQESKTSVFEGPDASAALLGRSGSHAMIPAP